MSCGAGANVRSQVVLAKVREMKAEEEQKKVLESHPTSASNKR